MSGYGINDVERSYGAGKELRAVKVPLASHKKCAEDFAENKTSTTSPNRTFALRAIILAILVAAILEDR